MDRQKHIEENSESFYRPAPPGLGLLARSLAPARFRHSNEARGMCLAVVITPPHLQSLNSQEEINQQKRKLAGRPKGHLRPRAIAGLSILPVTDQPICWNSVGRWTVFVWFTHQSDVRLTPVCDPVSTSISLQGICGDNAVTDFLSCFSFFFYSFTS